MYGAKTWTLRWNEQKRLEAFVICIWRSMERVKLTQKIKKCSCATKSGRRKINAGLDKENEKKLAGILPKKELPAEGWSRKNGKREEGSQQKKISHDRQQHNKQTVCKYEKEC